MSEHAVALGGPARTSRLLARVRPGAATAAVAGIAAAQIVAAYVGPIVAALTSGAVLVVLLVGYLVSDNLALARLFGALALVPLMSLCGLAMPIDGTIAALAAAGSLTLLAVVLAARALGRPWAPRGSRRPRVRGWRSVAAVAAVVAMTPLVAALLDPHPLVHGDSAATLLAAGLAVFVCVGVAEELLFRGVVQGALTPLAGDRAVLLANLLFVTAYAGAGPVGYVALSALVGHACGVLVRRTGGVSDAALLHGTVAATVLVLWPAML